jgi:hypothetical protein
MEESKPNKKFLYYEDNGDGTCTLTISIPEHEIFSSAILQMSLDDVFTMGATALSQEVADRIVVVPNSPENA